MSGGLPTNDKEWAQFAQAMKTAEPMRTENIAMMAQWGTPEDQWLRSYGAKLPSPTINPDTQLNFEQRVLNPSAYPKIQNDDGTFSTHRMAWGGGDGQFMAYPTIIHDGKALQRLDDQAAYEYAVKNKEFRSFSNEADAKAYAEGGYKKFWGLGEKR
jgi:hypothetical protein